MIAGFQILVLLLLAVIAVALISIGVLLSRGVRVGKDVEAAIYRLIEITKAKK